MKKLWITFKNTDFYLTHKEELIIIPILFLFFALVNVGLSLAFKRVGSAFYDIPSQLESLCYFLFNVVYKITAMIFIFRFVFPPLYHKVRNIYLNFNLLPELWQVLISFGMMAVFILAGALMAKGESKGDCIRNELKILLDAQLSIRETSANRGPEVDLFNQSVGAPLGSYWCAAYVSFNLTLFEIINPNSAWSPAFANPKDIVWMPKWDQKGKWDPTLKLGDVFTQFYTSLGRVGHVGFYLWTDKDGNFITQAGNTSGPGSRNGDRVGRHKIPPEKIYAISRYIKC
jgi:hypothetical protein